MPSFQVKHFIPLGPTVRLAVERRDDGFFDLRLERCSPAAHPRDPERWKPTQAGFRLPRDHVVTLRQALRDLGA